MVRADFTAWSLYTGPSDVKSIFDDPNCSWVVGQWDGINKNTKKKEVKKDIDYRIDVILNAFNEMLPRFKTNDCHFVIPEFFFHCKEGPYPYIKVDDKDKHYPFEYIVLRLKKELKKCILNDKHNDKRNYTIVVGSALTSNIENYKEFFSQVDVNNRQKQLNAILKDPEIYRAFKNHNYRHWRRHVQSGNSSNFSLEKLNDFMEEARRNPLCTVRNRGAYFYFNKKRKDEIEVFVYEKQSESSVDLTMGKFVDKGKDKGKITTNGMVTEWLCNYPSYSILKGDKKKQPLAAGARFSHPPYGDWDIGVEICLDHRFQRLRRTIDMSIRNGADVDNLPLFKQFIPSGGMQILDYAVAADRNSIIFNADGCGQICVSQKPEEFLASGECLASELYKGIALGVYSHSIQSQWAPEEIIMMITNIILIVNLLLLPMIQLLKVLITLRD